MEVELAAVDGSFNTELSLADGGLMLEDAKTAMGSVEPLARFGASAFGPVHVRVLSADGAAGDWLPLGTLVRLPGFKELRCPACAGQTMHFNRNRPVPDGLLCRNVGFCRSLRRSTGLHRNPITVPHPSSGILYLKLRDDPATVQTLTLPVTCSLLEAKPPRTSSSRLQHPTEPAPSAA